MGYDGAEGAWLEGEDPIAAAADEPERAAERVCFDLMVARGMWRWYGSSAGPHRLCKETISRKLLYQRLQNLDALRRVPALSFSDTNSAIAH